jgi:hypothetical protein
MNITPNSFLQNRRRAKEVTATAVDWLLGAIKLLLNPFRLLGTIWNSVSGLFDGEGDQTSSAKATKKNKLATATVGAALATQPAMALPDATLNALPQIEAISATTHNLNNVRIDAPITINASPGMDGLAIANEAQKALEQRQARADSDRRSVLFDQPQDKRLICISLQLEFNLFRLLRSLLLQITLCV